MVKKKNSQVILKTASDFFFSLEEFKPHTLAQTHTQFQRSGKKRSRQKNTTFTEHDFFKKVVKVKLFPEQKNAVPLPQGIEEILEVGSGNFIVN